MSRRGIIAGNWKMNKTVAEAVELAREIAAGADKAGDREIVVCPPLTALAEVAKALREGRVRVGALNVHWEMSGAFTGEISAPMLADLGCSYVIVGHSERRRLFGETDDAVARKLEAVRTAGMRPILCVGETLDDRKAERTEAVVSAQLEGALKDWNAGDPGELVIAYEPVWAIGTGVTAGPEQAEEVHRHIRRWLEGRFGMDFAHGVRILYGGSVNPENATGLMGQPDIDGALVGGASLKSRSFLGICGA